MGLLRILVTAIFGTAGTMIGALGGLFSSMIDGTGMMQGILIGANNGALFSVEFADSVLRLCFCADYFVEEQNPRTRLSLTADIIGSTVDSQADALQWYSNRELHGADLFQRSYEVLAARRATLPMTELTKETAGHHNTCCIICLSEFQAGEFARSLPACYHVFHLACIDSWFRRKSECPICRHPVH